MNCIVNLIRLVRRNLRLVERIVETDDGRGRDTEVLIAQLGARALHYIFNLSEGEYEDLTLGSKLSSRITGDTELFPMFRQFALLVRDQGNKLFVSHSWAQFLFRPVGDSTFVMFVRSHFGNLDPEISYEESPDGILRILARDLYVAALLPNSEERSYFGGGQFVSGYLGHPLRHSFEDGVMTDIDLGRLFPKIDASGNRTGYVYRSSGEGGTVDLMSLACCCLNYGEVVCRVQGRELSPESIADGAIEGLNSLRTGVRGEEFEIPVVVGVAGNLAEGMAQVSLGGAVLRRLCAVDRDRLVPRSLAAAEGRVPDEDGGDLILTFGVPGTLNFSIDGELPIDRCEDGISTAETRRRIDNILLASIISDDDRKMAVKEKWSVSLGPFSGGGIGYPIGDSRFHGPHPLIDEEFSETWEAQVNAIENCDQGKLTVSRSRLLSAVDELRSPEDALVDALIVWESFFGDRGEIVFQISACMAWLLCPGVGQYHERVAMKKRLAKIYELRSKIVHGGSAKSRESLILAVGEAIDAAAKTIRLMVGERNELLSLSPREKNEYILLGKFTAQ